MSEAVGVQLGRRIKELREAAQLTQADLAALSLKSVETISNFERGKTLPSVQTLAVLAEHLNCSMAEFFTSSRPQERDNDPAHFALTNRSRLLSERDKTLLLGIMDLLIANSRQ